jgi:hypothetical protein
MAAGAGETLARWQVQVLPHKRANHGSISAGDPPQARAASGSELERPPGRSSAPAGLRCTGGGPQ